MGKETARVKLMKWAVVSACGLLGNFRFDTVTNEYWLASNFFSHQDLIDAFGC